MIKAHAHITVRKEELFSPKSKISTIPTLKIKHERESQYSTAACLLLASQDGLLALLGSDGALPNPDHSIIANISVAYHKDPEMQKHSMRVAQKLYSPVNFSIIKGNFEGLHLVGGYYI